ncbi:WG repeat-containing protein [Actinoplanes flavus]|uniref:WG repeat-containing protein n=1 Tax=Actinoplanes flavus TaxID=2820290 RepID=A0ABS3UIB2_9ACTN|nr:WG repeat-containing protein [Actinoplanes flavus]MBO3738486.1 WG repeat-containing protein [Actinoplanes flavus]
MPARSGEARPVSPAGPSYGAARPVPAETFPAYADERRSPRPGRTPEAPFDLRPAPQDRNSPAPSRPAPQPTRVTPASAVPPAAVYPTVPGQTPGLSVPTGPGGVAPASGPVAPASGPVAPFGPDSRTGMPGHTAPAAPVVPGSPTTPGGVAPVSGPVAFQAGAPVAGAAPGVSFPATREDAQQGQDPTRPLDPRRSGRAPDTAGHHDPGSHPEDPTRPFDPRRTGAEGFGPGADRTQAIDPRALAPFAAPGQAPKPEEHTAVAGPRHGGDETQAPVGRHGVSADPRHAAVAPSEDVAQAVEAPTARPFATDSAVQPASSAPFATEPAAPPSTGAPSAAEPSTGGPGAASPVTGVPFATDPSTGGPGTASPVTGVPFATDPSTGGPGTASPVTGVPFVAEPSAGGPSGAEASGEESETHGLGWLLSMSGLGATTPVPDAEPAVVAEEVPDTPQPLGWFAPGELDDDTRREEAESTAAEAEGVPAGDGEALRDVDDSAAEAGDEPQRLYADYLTDVEEPAEADLSVDAESIDEADGSGEHADVAGSADPGEPFPTDEPAGADESASQTDATARPDAAVAQDDAAEQAAVTSVPAARETDATAHPEAAVAQDDAAEQAAVTSVPAARETDATARPEAAVAQDDAAEQAAGASVPAARETDATAHSEATVAQDDAAEQAAVTSVSAAREHDDAGPEGFAGEETPSPAEEGLLPDGPGPESAVSHGGVEEISTETTVDASEAVRDENAARDVEVSHGDSEQVTTTVVPSSEDLPPVVSYLLAGSADERTDESTEEPHETGDAPAGQPTESVPAVDSASPVDESVLPETEGAVSEAPGVDESPETDDAVSDALGVQEGPETDDAVSQAPGMQESPETDDAISQAPDVDESPETYDAVSDALAVQESPETEGAVSDAPGVEESEAPDEPDVVTETGATFDGDAMEDSDVLGEGPSGVVSSATGDSPEVDEAGPSADVEEVGHFSEAEEARPSSAAGNAADGGNPDDAEGEPGTTHEGDPATAAVDDGPRQDEAEGDEPGTVAAAVEAPEGDATVGDEPDSGAHVVPLNGVTPADEEAGGAAADGVAERSREAPPEARTEPVRQRRDQRAPADRRRADPEQILASYTWEFDPRTLREQVDEPDRLWDLVDRLTDRLEYAERDNVRAGLLGLRAVVSRVLGELDDALADGREAVRHAEASGELRPVSIAQARLAHVLQWRGEFAEADRLFAQADSPELPGRIRAEISELAGRSAFEQGRYLEAVNHFERALNVRRSDDPELVERVELALDAITRRTGDGWGPYPRTRDELLGLPEAPMPLLDDGAGLWGYAAAVEPRYAEAQPFAEGVAWVRRPDSHAWELIDSGGELVIPAAHGYLAVGRFADGLAWVTRGDTTGWFAIDRQNRLVVAPAGFEDARPFRGGLAAVRQGGLWGAVDRHGRIAVRPRFRRFATVLHVGGPVDGFTDEGLAVVDAGERLGVLDRTGQLVVAAVHAAVVIHPSAFLVRNAAGLWGALDREGEPLVDVGHRDPESVVELLPDEVRPVL